MSLTSTQKKENNIVELEIAVSPEELKAATDAVFRRKVKTITVPGFRKGKAPRGIIEKMYGEGVFMEDAVNDLFPGAYEAAVEEAGIEPVDKAEVEVLKVDKETGFSFKATVTVKPEVSISDYKGLEADKILYEVSAEDVDKEIERMRESNSRMVTVEDRPAKDGDITVIDFEGSVDGVPFDGGKGSGFQLTLGSGQFIEGFEEQIVGKNTGDEFDVNVTFPEEYHAEELAGKPAVFKVKLHEIKEKELPALDDEFAKDVSEFDTLAELRKDIEKKFAENNDKRSQEDLENALVTKVVAKLEGDIPQCMFDNKVDEMVRDFEYRLSSQGMQLPMYLQYTGMDLEAFRESFKDQAVRQVKIRLALEKIAELENIQVSDEDYDAEVKKLSENYGVDAERITGVIPKKDILADVKCTRAIDVIRDSAKVIEKKEADVTVMDDLRADAEQDLAAGKDKDEAKDEAAEPAAEEKPAKAKKPAAKKPAAPRKKKAEKTEENADAPAEQ